MTHLRPKQRYRLIGALVVLLTFGIAVFPGLYAFRQHLLIHAAVERRDLPAVERLINQGAEIESPTEQLKETCLMRAARTGNLPMVELLAKHGANLSAIDSLGHGVVAYALGSTPGQRNTLEFLLSRGAPVDLRTRVDGETPLMSAARGGELELVKLLVSYGADVHARNTDGLSAALLAEKYKNPSVARYLREIEAGRSHPPLAKTRFERE